MRSLSIKTKAKIESKAKSRAETTAYCTLDLEAGGSCQKFCSCKTTIGEKKKTSIENLKMTRVRLIDGN